MAFLVWIGIVFAFVGIAVLIYMAILARKTAQVHESEREVYTNKLILLNYLGLGFGVFGLILIIISLLF